MATNRADLNDIADPTRVASQSLSFSDVLSSLNPLQHIPIVGDIYRSLTGDRALPAARILVGALTGPVGFASSLASALIEEATGKGIGEQALALVLPSKEKSPTPAQMAKASTAPTVAPSPAAATPPVAPDAAAAPGADGALVPEIPPALSTSPAPAPAESAAPVAIPASASVPLPATTTPGAFANPLLPAAAAAAKPGTPGGAPAGRTLADYWASAGQRMPTIDNNRGAAPNRTAIPLQLSAPLPNDTLHAPVATPAAQPVAATAATSDQTQPNDWVSAAMLKGLDRYREMKQRDELSAQPRKLDTAL